MLVKGKGLWKVVPDGNVSYAKQAYKFICRLITKLSFFVSSH